tara:strand:- start:414 stop:656 length:243 start_codon:yes stop_codon:yes gene_type:complete
MPWLQESNTYLDPWHTTIGSMLFMGGLFSSYNASTNMFVVTAQFPHVRLSPREVKQIYLELTAPLILAAHILGTRFPGEG